MIYGNCTHSAEGKNFVSVCRRAVIFCLARDDIFIGQPNVSVARVSGHRLTWPAHATDGLCAGRTMDASHSSQHVRL